MTFWKVGFRLDTVFLKWSFLIRYLSYSKIVFCQQTNNKLREECMQPSRLEPDFLGQPCNARQIVSNRYWLNDGWINSLNLFSSTHFLKSRIVARIDDGASSYWLFKWGWGGAVPSTQEVKNLVEDSVQWLTSWRSVNRKIIQFQNQTEYEGKQLSCR